MCKFLHLHNGLSVFATEEKNGTHSFSFSRRLWRFEVKGVWAGLQARGLVYFPARAPVPLLQSALTVRSRPTPPSLCARSTGLRSTVPVVLTAELSGVFLLAVLRYGSFVLLRMKLKKSHQYLVITRKVISRKINLEHRHINSPNIALLEGKQGAGQQFA